MSIDVTITVSVAGEYLHGNGARPLRQTFQHEATGAGEYSDAVSAAIAEAAARAIRGICATAAVGDQA